jgi:hypothetical protein
MTCTTHHHACDCREAAIRRALVLASVYTRWDDLWQAREFDALVRQIYGGEGGSDTKSTNYQPSNLPTTPNP